MSCNSLVATEKLNLTGMTRRAKGQKKRQKSGLNRSLLDVGIGNLKSLIKYKVTEAGGFYKCQPERLSPLKLVLSVASSAEKHSMSAYISVIVAAYLIEM